MHGSCGLHQLLDAKIFPIWETWLQGVGLARGRTAASTQERLEYTMVAGRQRVSVTSAADGRTVAIALANDVSGHLAGATGRIIFRCYDTRCFLAELWSPTEQNGRQLLISPAESERSRESSGTYFAILGTKPAK